MPNFSVESWSHFKQELLSVIDWILYSFSMLFDNFRSHPMLYAFAFFPIFALTFYTIISLVLHIVPNSGLDMQSDNHSILKHIGSNSKSRGAAVNLAAINKAAASGVNSSLKSFNNNSNISTVATSKLGSPSSGTVKPAALGSTHSASGNISSLMRKGVKAVKADRERRKQDEEVYAMIEAEQAMYAADHAAAASSVGFSNYEHTPNPALDIEYDE